MSEPTVISIAPDALDMILQLRDQEPGEGEFSLSIEVTGFRGPQFTYELAFVALADKKEGWVVERHGDLAVIFPEADIPKLDGASLDLTDQGLAMNNPNSPSSPAMSGVHGDLTGPLVDQVQQRHHTHALAAAALAHQPQRLALLQFVRNAVDGVNVPLLDPEPNFQVLNVEQCPHRWRILLHFE